MSKWVGGLPLESEAKADKQKPKKGPKSASPPDRDHPKTFYGGAIPPVPPKMPKYKKEELKPRPEVKITGAGPPIREEPKKEPKAPPSSPPATPPSSPPATPPLSPPATPPLSPPATPPSSPLTTPPSSPPATPPSSPPATPPSSPPATPLSSPPATPPPSPPLPPPSPASYTTPQSSPPDTSPKRLPSVFDKKPKKRKKKKKKPPPPKPEPIEPDDPEECGDEVCGDGDGDLGQLPSIFAICYIPKSCQGEGYDDDCRGYKEDRSGQASPRSDEEDDGLDIPAAVPSYMRPDKFAGVFGKKIDARNLAEVDPRGWHEPRSE